MKTFPTLFVFISGAITSFFTLSAEPVAVSPSDPSTVQKALSSAIAGGESKVTIPPGVYKLSPKGGAHLEIENANNLEIDASGATFIFTERTLKGLFFRNCSNVTLRGVTLKWEQLPYSQGKIEAISDDGKVINVRIDAGYPTELDNRKLFPHFWASTFTTDGKIWTNNYRAATPPVMDRLAPDLWRIQMATLPDELGHPIPLGTPIAWRGDTPSDVAIRTCSKMKFINIIVKGGAGFVFHEQGGDGGNLYQNCKITYPDMPEGSPKALFSTCADGLHSINMRVGPTIENCLFEGIDDDAIAIHGTYSLVIESTEKKIIIAEYRINGTNPLFCKVGDKLRFNNKRGAWVADATVTEVKEASNYTPPKGYYPPPNNRLFQNPEAITYVEISLDKEVPLRPNFFVSNENEAGSGYIIRNCTIRNSSARGCMVKASKGLIEGCTFENLARAAIEFMSEMEIWVESDYSRDIIVRKNTIRNVSLNRQKGNLRHPGALTIFNYKDGNYVPLPGGHRNILIEDNIFENNDGTNILITSAQDVTIRNNKFVNPMKNSDEFGRDKGVDPQSLVWITHASNVQISGNTISMPGSFLKKTVSNTDTGTGSGFDNGFKVLP